MPPRQPRLSKPLSEADKVRASWQAVADEDMDSMGNGFNLPIPRPEGPSFDEAFGLPFSSRPRHVFTSLRGLRPTQAGAITEQPAESTPDDGDVDMADAGSVSPTDVLPQSEAPSATASHARSSPSMSAADSFPSTASSSRASPIPQDTEMTAEDELIASQMLDDDERAELDETGSVAQTSESVPQSVAESEAEPEDGNAVVDKSTRPRHVPGPDGDIETLLWVAPKRESVMSVLTKMSKLLSSLLV